MRRLDHIRLQSLLKLALLIALFGVALLLSFAPAQSNLIESPHVKVYFSNPFDLTSTKFEQDLIDFIDNASRQLDIAVYEINSQQIMTALSRACQRGVAVRIVTGIEISNQVACIETRFNTDRDIGSMHHKFAAADQQRIWTGSANWTESGLRHNANNAVVIESEHIASKYLQAFEWLFGQAQFGKQLPGVAPGPYQLNQLSAKLFFAPNPQNENEIVRIIQSAKSSIQLAMFYYTNEEIHLAILDAISRGIRVDALWSQRGIHDCMISLMDDLMRLGIGRISPLEGALHHKFAIIDDDVVITGSANWTNSGMGRNDENILILHSRFIAMQFQQEFLRLKQDTLHYSTQANQIRWVNRHFNQQPGTIRLEWHPITSNSLEGYEVCRSSTANVVCESPYTTLSQSASFFVDHQVSPNKTYIYQLNAIFSDGRIIRSKPFIASSIAGPTSLSASEVEAQAKTLYGSSVRVDLGIHHIVKTSGGHVLLHTSEAVDSDFTAFVPACAVERFEATGIDINSLTGESIQVMGELQSYRGPEIILYDPGQVIFKE